MKSTAKFFKKFGTNSLSEISDFDHCCNQPRQLKFDKSFSNPTLACVMQYEL